MAGSRPRFLTDLTAGRFTNSSLLRNHCVLTKCALRTLKNSFPYVSCKGADTVLLFRWLEFAIKLWLPDISDQNICATMRLVLLGVQQGLAFTRGIHHHGLWLPASCSERLARACRDFNYAYTSLAAQCLSENLSLFGMVRCAKFFRHGMNLNPIYKYKEGSF